MRKDAADKLNDGIRERQGIAPGGIIDFEGIQVLICYLLKNIPQPLTKAQLDEILPGSELVNYFDYSQALDLLQKNGNIARAEDGCFEITPRGAKSCDILQDSLPVSIRDRILGRGMRVVHKTDVLAENEFSIETIDDNVCLVCNIKDRGGLLMSMRAAVGSGELAASLGRQFLKNPELLYNAVFAVLSADHGQLSSLAEKMADSVR